MPLMKVRNQDNNAWHTVNYLNFQRIGIGEITLSSDDGKKINTNTNEIIAYESYVKNNISACMPKLLTAETNMSSTSQKNFSLTTPKGQDGQFLLEHRTLSDKNEIFHILNYWNGSKWVPLNNIWG